jgi:hypothetical protein
MQFILHGVKMLSLGDGHQSSIYPYKFLESERIQGTIK